MSVHVCTLNLLNLVIAASDPKDIHMNCPDVTLRYIKSHLYSVVFISTCNVFILFLRSFFGAKLQATNRVPRPVDRGTATRYGG